MAKKREVNYINGRLCGKYLTEEVCNKLESLRSLGERKGFIKDLKNIIYELQPSEIDLIRASGCNDFVDFSDRQGELSNLQTIGVAYMYFAERLVLGDSVGIGKTVEVCGLFNLLERSLMKEGKEFRFLFLTGKNLVSQARDEIIKFTGNYVQTVYGEKPKVQKFVKENYLELTSSVVGTHSLIKSLEFQEYMRTFKADTGNNPFDILVIDESGDVLTNTTTQTYKDAKYLANMFDRVILLNATSFESNLKAFYNQLAFVDDSFLPTKEAFSKEYEIMDYYGPYPTPSGKYKNADKFRQLVGYRYFARTRKGSGAKMENCTADVNIVPLSQDQRWLLTKTSMPQMVYDCPSYFNMGIETNTTTTPKLKEVIRILREDEIFKNAKSVLIYCRYKESQRCIQEVLAEHGYASEILNGESSQQVRESVINKFKLGDISILITNVQKGLNFGNCNHCIFYTYDPSPDKMVQFEGRITRSFDIENKHVRVLLSRGKELSTFKTTIADKAKASDMFAGSDFSCILSILLDSDKLKDLK